MAHNGDADTLTQLMLHKQPLCYLADKCTDIIEICFQGRRGAYAAARSWIGCKRGVARDEDQGVVESDIEER